MEIVPVIIIVEIMWLTVITISLYMAFETIKDVNGLVFGVNTASNRTENRLDVLLHHLRLVCSKDSYWKITKYPKQEAR